MLNNIYKIILSFFIFSLLFINQTIGAIVNKIEINGNERIPAETIIMFSSVSLNDELNSDSLNKILKSIYDSNFFKNVNVEFNNNTLIINVQENPIIEKVQFNGIKAKRIREALQKNIILKSRSSFDEISLKKDKENIAITLKELGFYFPIIEIFLEDLGDNKVNLKYEIDLGNKSKIKKITFLGNKIYKDNKLRNLIVSEEYKFWKFISGKKFLNENLLILDKRLLKNFYLSKGYYDVVINSSFAKLIDKDQFELIFNVDAKNKFYFNDIELIIPDDFSKENFFDLEKLFEKLKGEPYSLSSVNKILDEVDEITATEEFYSTKATVEENISLDKINLKFVISETDKFFIEKINIYGNNITRENVIRNQFEVDEGDPFNEILQKKSLNNIKNLNFFKTVKSEILEGTTKNAKIINIFVQEKPTGQISAGAGVGTSGGTISAGVKENNYLGKGISVSSDLTIDQESIKGMLTITNPNYKNSDKLIYTSFQATEIDRIKDFGYKTNKVGFTLGTDFEYLKNFDIGIGTSTFYEKIETDSTASARQKKMKGNYWDTFLKFNFNYDKRNQKFQTTDGFRSAYSINLPIISDTNTITNTYDYKFYTELYEKNISTVSFLLQAANSISNDDIKLTERLYIPQSRLRGFANRKIGPKDGTDFIGGNFVSAINFSSTLPQILENAQDIDVLLFFDAARIWGVDYDSSLDNNPSKIRSSVGVGIDWFTALGPLNFSLSLPLSKDTKDQTESFRFNLGTTF
jgi:outer membrane protein insertion porin family